MYWQVKFRHITVNLTWVTATQLKWINVSAVGLYNIQCTLPSGKFAS